MSEYRLKTGKLGEKAIGVYEKIEKRFADRFLNEDGSMKTGKIGEAVIDTYEKIEDGVVGAYKKVEDAFVDTFLEKEKDE